MKADPFSGDFAMVDALSILLSFGIIIIERSRAYLNLCLRRNPAELAQIDAIRKFGVTPQNDPRVEKASFEFTQSIMMSSIVEMLCSLIVSFSQLHLNQNFCHLIK